MVEKVTVEEMYKYWRDLDEPMFTTFIGDFWNVYKQYYTYFDHLFYKTYRSFIIYNVRDNVDMHNAGVDWSVDITAFLLTNEKRYEELYRLQELNDIDYSLLEPYHVTESHSITSSGSETDNKGAKTRTKSDSMAYGAVTTTDSGNNVHGAKSETDGKTTNYGQDKITTTEENNIGRQINEEEHKRSAMNESTYSPKDITSNEYGTRQDTSEKEETRLSRSDTESGTHTEAAYTDTTSNTHTVQTHSDTGSSNINDSAYTDTKNTTGTESKTITKKGNMGIYSFPKLLSEHKELWNAFNFYKMIFDEIADEFLRIEY